MLQTVDVHLFVWMGKAYTEAVNLKLRQVLRNGKKDTKICWNISGESLQRRQISFCFVLQ